MAKGLRCPNHVGVAFMKSFRIMRNMPAREMMKPIRTVTPAIMSIEWRQLSIFVNTFPATSVRR